MNLHEYQGKQLLAGYGVKVPKSSVANTPEEAVSAAKALFDQGSKGCAVKAQIHAGGRGKGGGVKIAKTLEDVKKYANDILGMMLITPQTSKEGKLVSKVLIEENVFIDGPSEPQEFYVSVLMDREKYQNVIIYSPKGGMNIEQVAEETPELVFKEYIHPGLGLRPFQASKIAFNLGLSGKAMKEMVAFVKSLYAAFLGSDASLFEINPCFKSANDEIMAIDCKVSLDNSALYRHPDLAAFHDPTEEDPTELEAKEFDLNYVNLDGNIGCMVNGAGLAMATMDMIKLSGGEPANFLDVGGTADATRVENAFRIILKDPKVKAILVNIFGGIVRCDRVANGVVDAYKNIGDIKVPIIVRLQGTNADIAKEIIDNSGLNVISAISLQDAADAVASVV